MQALVFRQIPAHRSAVALPVRNPLAEVRWLAFFRGDAYVNLLQDLLYAVARPHGLQPQLAAVAHLQVSFTENRITVERPGKEVLEYPYAEIPFFRLNYTSLYHEEAIFPEAGQQGFYTSLRSSSGTLPLWEYRLAMNRRQFLQLVDFLYARRVAFREFYGGTRSYRLDAHVGYRRIQELKEKYGIEW